MINQNVLDELKDYLDLHLNQMLFSETKFSISEDIHHLELEAFLKEKRQPSFKEILFQFIDEKGVSDAEVYTRADIDRRHFSKIRSTPNYKPKKRSVIALGLALELELGDIETLLNAVGYSLSDNDKTDLIVQFFIEREIYNLHDINSALNHFSLKTIP